MTITPQDAASQSCSDLRFVSAPVLRCLQLGPSEVVLINSVATPLPGNCTVAVSLRAVAAQWVASVS